MIVVEVEVKKEMENVVNVQVFEVKFDMEFEVKLELQKF